MKTNLYVIPYSLKSLNASQEETIRIAKEIGFDGVEGGMLTPDYLELLDKYQMKALHFMVKPEADGTISDETLKLLEKYSQNRIVNILSGDFKMPFSDPVKGYRGIPGAFGTFGDAIKAAEKANVTARLAAKYGLCTMYHNHTHEWRVDHGEYVMDTYLRHTDSNHVMEFDVGWALTAGIDPIDWMKRWPGRIGALHIKSCNWKLNPEALGMSCPVPMPEIGIFPDQQAIQQTYAEGPQGPMSKSICDWHEVIQTAKAVGCNTFIIERERIYNEPKDIVSCLQADHDWIRKCME